MYSKENLTEIIELRSGRAVQVFSKQEENQAVIEKIYEDTSFLPTDAGLIQRVVCLYNDITHIPICECGTQLQWNKTTRKFRTFCSVACKAKSTKTKQKVKQTVQARYGVNNSFLVGDKRQKTNNERYGVDWPQQNEDIHEKSKQTNRRNTGVDYPLQNQKIKQQHTNTLLKNFGVDNPSKSDIIQSRKVETHQTHHNRDHHSQRHISPNTLALLNDANWLKNKHITQQMSLLSIGHELGVDQGTVKRYMDIHAIDIQRFCVSGQEQELREFINSIYDGNIIVNSRSIIPPKELDIFLPDINIAFEYNGLFWHNDQLVSRNYHLNKTQLCESCGIRLIHIFEDEWLFDRTKCEQTIKHLLGKSERGDYGRNLNIKEISWGVAKEFLDKHHLLNSGSSGSYRIGAYNNMEELCGVMVFGHQNNEGSGSGIELKRFVTNKKNNPGMGSKMFKYAVEHKQYDSVVAFVDRRWFTGLVKDHIGFKFVHYTKPALWWCKNQKRFHRRFTTKEKLLSNDNYKPTMSKRDILFQQGYHRIWDCGKVKLIWEAC